MRLDAWLVKKGHFSTREKAKAAVMAGNVYVNGEVVLKAGARVPPDAEVTVKGAPHPYVSRGGLKLKKALDMFHFDMADAVVIDIGASTGGFTDCALQHGAAHVYAVDVGYGQLAWKLRQDSRVTVMERTNFRYATPEMFAGPPPTAATIDVSFISLDKILPPLKRILPIKGAVIALIKPQFEAGRAQVGKKGIVYDASVHRDVLLSVLQMAERNDFHMHGLTCSPITGSKGNVEFLVHWVHQHSPRWSSTEIKRWIERTVTAAHETGQDSRMR